MKWTQAIRKVMYLRIFEEFGPCSEWHNKNNPTGNLEDYKKFSTDIAIGLSKLTGKDFTGKKENDLGSAVRSQIAWGIQEIQQSCINAGAVTNFVNNRAIALEVGLIKSSDMPNCAEFGYKRNLPGKK